MTEEIFRGLVWKINKPAIIKIWRKDEEEEVVIYLINIDEKLVNKEIVTPELFKDIMEAILKGQDIIIEIKTIEND